MRGSVVLAGTGNVAYRKRVFDEIGLFDLRFSPKFREDSDVAIRCVKVGFKMLFQQSAVVFHPPKPLSFRRMMQVGIMRKKDALLYSKHSDCKRQVAPHLGGSATQPLLGGISPLGLFFITGLIGLAIGLLLNPSAVFSAFSVGFIWGLDFFVLGAYRFVSSGRKPRVSTRLAAAIRIPVYLLAITLGRAYGSIKHRKLLL
jgi:hypothetical protein